MNQGSIVLYANGGILNFNSRKEMQNTKNGRKNFKILKELNSLDVHVSNILTNISARHSVDRMGEGGGDWIQS